VRQSDVNDPLIACQECDLVQREVALAGSGTARCQRCDAMLYRGQPESLERTLALTIGAIILFVNANVFPLAGIEIHGQLIQTTLFNTVRTLYEQQMRSVAVLVFLTAIAMPALELFALTYLLLPLRLGRVPAYFAPMFRLLQAVQPWNMIEIFMLGALISLVKIANLASIEVGVAMWSLAALMLVMTAITATFDARALWARAGTIR
jgi:paraquat-inducible protein A